MQKPQKLLHLILLGALLLLPALLPVTASARTPRRSAHARHNADRRHSKPREHAKSHGKRAKLLVQTPHRTHELSPRKRAREEAEAMSAAQASKTDAEAVIASVLATPCSNTEVTPTEQNLAVVREAVLCLVNRERAEHDVAPLAFNAKLEAAAENHCAELIEDDYFAHVAPDGETPVQRIEKFGYIPGPEVGYVIGENLAWGTYQLSTPQSIVSAWIASPGHLANILESRYTETGIGVTPAVPQSLGEGNPGATYAQEFGVIVH